MGHPVSESEKAHNRLGEGTPKAKRPPANKKFPDKGDPMGGVSTRQNPLGDCGVKGYGPATSKGTKPKEGIDGLKGPGHPAKPDF